MTMGIQLLLAAVLMYGVALVGYLLVWIGVIAWKKRHGQSPKTWPLPTKNTML